MIKDTIHELDRLLRIHNPVNYNRLQSPLLDRQIESYLQELGINDQDVFELYRWKNGVFPAMENRAMLFESRVSLLSLESVLSCKDMYDDQFDEDHIMLFASPFDTGFLFNKGLEKNYGKLHLYSVPLLSIENPYSYYDSILTMLESNIQAYEAGFFQYNKDDDILNYKFGDILNILKSLNNESEYWDQF